MKACINCIKKELLNGIVRLVCGVLGLLIVYFPARSQSQNMHPREDSLISRQISELIKNPDQLPLRFPVLTQQVYRGQDYCPLLFTTEREDLLVLKVLALLKSAPYYGLNSADYHINAIDAVASKSSLLREKARQDILLTDALLSFIAHLHYGKLNPAYPEKKLDTGRLSEFRIDSVLHAALQSNSIEQTILRSQPSFQGYKELIERLSLLIPQQKGIDIYDSIRLINLNLERWRWERPEDSIYVAINIPAYRLDFISANGMKEEFKVIVGKPATPTPLLQSDIRFFVTAPDWYVPSKVFLYELLPKALKKPTYLIKNHFFIYDKEGREVVPTLSNLKLIREKSSDYLFVQLRGTGNTLGRVVFSFNNPYSIYMHDTPVRSLFNEPFRALSYGGVQLEAPGKLVQLLLEADGAPPKVISKMNRAMKVYRQRKYVLGRPVPIRVRYFTCEIKNGVLFRYDDIYHLDEQLNKIIVNL